MNPGLVILLIFFGSVALVAVITLTLFRFFTRLLGLKQVIKEGVVLTDDGLEYLGFLWLGKLKASYVDVESVEVLPFSKGLISILFFRYGLSSHWIGPRLFREMVAIKLKGQRVYKYLLFTPMDARVFAEKLKSRSEVSPKSEEGGL
ncbi:MAG TPA: hypothetical protein VGH42_07595 [Verrucomicrobiae bacterium]|jgi:hypothetical protein